MSLHVVVGPMFAGKTSEALRVIRMNRSVNRRVLVVTHKTDVRYSDGCVSSHDMSTCPAIFVTDLMALISSAAFTQAFTLADVIIIEEAQFFSDLLEFAKISVDKHGKEVHVFGLDGDYQRQPMGDILKLCPLADSFRKINALCLLCQTGSMAPFTVNSTPMPQSGILVGGAEVYTAVCRKHFLLN